MSSVAFQYDIVEEQTSSTINVCNEHIDDFEVEDEGFSYGNLETENPFEIPTDKITQLIKIELTKEKEEKIKTHTSFKTLLDVYGVISNVSEDGLVLADIYHHNGEYKQEVEFSISEFDQSDHGLVEDEGVFYWRVGQKTVNGTTSDTSEFRMRRLVTYNFPFNKKKIEETSQKYRSIFGSTIHS